jgi:molybdopterin-biosynthesis enzyme MoeA-like protein
MAKTPDKPNKPSSIPTAKEVMQKVAQAEAERASEAMRRETAVAAEKKAQIERLKAPSGVSHEEAIERVTNIIERAVSNGLTEVQVYRFPNTLCTDNGRAINQQERGWEATLTGVPKEIYNFWKSDLQPRGYVLYAQIVEFPGGVPGDVGITLKWG